VGYQVLGVLLGIVGLNGVYRLIEGSWPQNYFSLTDFASYRKTIHPLGYMAFRFAPVFLVALFLAVSLERGDQAVWPASMIMISGHVALTHGWAAIALVSQPADPRRSPLVALHVVASVLLIGVGAAGVLLREHLAALIPPLESLAGELWGAAFAGAFGAFLITRTGTRIVDEDALIRKARQRIAPDLLELARREAERNGADPDLVEAILITEDIQRPKWFRSLERAKSVFFRDGTYGVMQVRHLGWLSDADSIRTATAGVLAGQQIPIAELENTDYEYQYVDTDALRSQLSEYNRSRVWTEMLVEVLRVVQGSPGKSPL